MSWKKKPRRNQAGSQVHACRGFLCKRRSPRHEDQIVLLGSFLSLAPFWFGVRVCVLLEKVDGSEFRPLRNIKAEILVGQQLLNVEVRSWHR